MDPRRHTCYQGCIALSEHIPHQPWQEHTSGQWLHQSLQSPQTLLQVGAVALLAHDQLIGWWMGRVTPLERCCGTTAIGSTPPQQTAAATEHSRTVYNFGGQFALVTSVTSNTSVCIGMPRSSNKDGNNTMLSVVSQR